MTENNIKVLFLGESGVGKSSLIVRYFEDKFEENIIPSRTSSYFKKIINNGGKKYNFDIFDTPGAQNLRALTKVFMKDVKIIVLVYDITIKGSFLDLQYWLDVILESYPETYLILVGNKHDLSTNRKIKESTGTKFAEIIKAEFTEISAKDNYGWKDFLDNAFNNYIKNIKNIKGEDEYLDDDFYDRSVDFDNSIIYI